MEKVIWTRNHNLQPILEPGQKCVVLGQSGTGKTVIGAHYLPYQPGKWVVFNPILNPILEKQADKIIDVLPDADYVKRFKGKRLVVSKLMNRESHDYMDQWIDHLQTECKDIGLFLDELNMFSTSRGVAGPGLRNWCSMGRQRGLSLFAIGQRPQMAPQNVLSEANYVCSTGLSAKRDWKNLDLGCGAGEILGFAPDRSHRWRIAQPSFNEYNKMAAVPE